MKHLLTTILICIGLNSLAQNKVILTLPSGTGTIDTTSLSNRINLKVDSVISRNDSIFYWQNGNEYFVNVSGGGSYVAGNGIKIDGSTIRWADTLGATSIFLNNLLGFTSNNSNFEIFEGNVHYASNGNLFFVGNHTNKLLSKHENLFAGFTNYFLAPLGNKFYTSISGDSIFLNKKYDDNGGMYLAGYYTPTTTSTAKYKVMLMDSTTGALVTISPDSLGGSGSTDTTSLSNRINLKLNISDTASMLTPYALLTEVPAQFNPIAGTNVTLSGTYPNITFNATGGGSADSTTFATNYRVDTAKTNIRNQIAALSDHTSRISFFTDFLVAVPANDGGGTVIANNGTGAAFTTGTSYGNRPGVQRSSTGTTATGRSGFGTNNVYVYESPGTLVWEGSMDLQQLSNSTESFTLIWGFVDQLNSTNQSNAIFFAYDTEGFLGTNTPSEFLKMATCSTNARTFTVIPGDIIPSINTWVKYRIEVKQVSSVTTAQFYINDVLSGSQTSNIPILQMRAGVYLFKHGTGVVPVTYEIDYMKVDYEFGTAR